MRKRQREDDIDHITKERDNDEMTLIILEKKETKTDDIDNIRKERDKDEMILIILVKKETKTRWHWSY